MEEGSAEKAKKFIKKSLYTNIENNDNVENKDYDKFKKSLILFIKVTNNKEKDKDNNKK